MNTDSFNVVHIVFRESESTHSLAGSPHRTRLLCDPGSEEKGRQNCFETVRHKLETEVIFCWNRRDPLKSLAHGSDYRPGNSHMARRYFGTDGIRGRANSQITADMALKVGQAAGLAFRRCDHRHRVVIGKDTPLLSYMIEYALVSGFASVGADVLLLGPVPTPVVAMLTRWHCQRQISIVDFRR